MKFNLTDQIREARLRLQTHAEKMGCKPVFGGHAELCRCFAHRLRIAELEAYMAEETDQ